jgi:hypothetical protein
MWLIGETSEKDHFNVYRIGLAMSAVASAGLPAPAAPNARAKRIMASTCARGVGLTASSNHLCGRRSHALR